MDFYLININTNDVSKNFSELMTRTDIQKKLNKVYQVESYTHNELDITNSNLVESKIRELTPNLVINSAAYTNVEKGNRSDSFKR